MIIRIKLFGNLRLCRGHSFVTILALVSQVSCQSECGDFYDMEPGLVGNIYSPGFPNMYPVHSFCIWLIAVPQKYNVQLILTFTGERYNGECSDYVEVRDGSKTARLLGQFCDQMDAMELTSTAQWMWIKFKSDRIEGGGRPMHAVFTPLYNKTGQQPTKAPFDDCRSYEFVCRNKECLSMSYRCDGHNDCGCLKNCDEALCEGLKIAKSSQIAISIIVGVIVFGLLCLVTYCIEGKNNWIASQAEALREKEIAAEKQRQRASRAFTKFIGGEKELLSNKPKSRMNLAARPSTARMLENA